MSHFKTLSDHHNIESMQKYLAGLFALNGVLMFVVACFLNDTSRAASNNEIQQTVMGVVALAQFLIGARIVIIENIRKWQLETLLWSMVLIVCLTIWASGTIGTAPLFFVFPALYAAYYYGPHKAAAHYLVTIVCFAFAAEKSGATDQAAAVVATAAMLGSVTLIIQVISRYIQSITDVLQYAASYDQLTGIYNRASFEATLEEASRTADRTDKRYSMAFMDIDYFKRINDRFGHSGGDKALQHFASIVNDAKDKNDVFARIGGEEFAILMPDTELAQAQIRCEKIRAAVEAKTRNHHAFTVSIGLVCTDGAACDKVMKTADRALYDAKSQGRNCVRDYVMTEGVQSLCAWPVAPVVTAEPVVQAETSVIAEGFAQPA